MKWNRCRIRGLTDYERLALAMVAIVLLVVAIVDKILSG